MQTNRRSLIATGLPAVAQSKVAIRASGSKRSVSAPIGICVAPSRRRAFSCGASSLAIIGCDLNYSFAHAAKLVGTDFTDQGLLEPFGRSEDGHCVAARTDLS